MTKAIVEADQRFDDQKPTNGVKIRQKPGFIAYTFLAIMIFLSLVGIIKVESDNRRKAREVTAANCVVAAATREGYIDLLNRLTAPRQLGANATQAQIDAQNTQNAKAAKTREEQIGKLKAFSCEKLKTEVNPEVINVDVPPLPEAVKGPSGEAGASGITGPAGIDGINGKDGAPGKDGIDGKDGPPGAPGINGRDGADGMNGATGPAGSEGPPGADATTTTTTTTTQPPILPTLPPLFP